MIKALFKFTILLVIILALLIWAISYLPAKNAANWLGVDLPPNAQITGTVGEGTLTYTYEHHNPSPNQSPNVRWARDGLTTWDLTISSQPASGDAAATIVFDGVEIYFPNLNGIVDTKTVSGSVAEFSYSLEDGRAHANWGHPIAFSQGTLHVKDLTVYDFDSWRLIGDYDLALSNNGPTTIADITSAADNDFWVEAQANIGYENQYIAQYILDIEGIYQSRNDHLRFPWMIPLNGEATEDGKPFEFSAKFSI